MPPIEKRTQSSQIKINAVTLIRSGSEDNLNIMNLVKVIKIDWSMHKLFPTCKIVFQSQVDFANYLKSSDRIRVSYQSGLIDNYYEKRDILFKISNVAGDMIGQSIPVHVSDFDMVDENYYDLAYGRFSKKYKDTKLNILNDIFKSYNFRFDAYGSDTEEISYYMLNSKINKDIHYIRLLGDEPIFLYRKMNDNAIYGRDVDSLLEQDAVVSLKSDRSIGKNAKDMMQNVNNVVIHNFFNQSKDASGYKLYSFDEDSKTVTYTNRYIQNDEQYDVDRIASMKMVESCGYKERYYLTKRITFDLTYVNTSLNVGDVINFTISKTYDNAEKAIISGKHIIFGLEETIDMESLTMSQNLTIFKK